MSALHVEVENYAAVAVRAEDRERGSADAVVHRPAVVAAGRTRLRERELRATGRGRDRSAVVALHRSGELRDLRGEAVSAAGDHGGLAARLGVRGASVV